MAIERHKEPPQEMQHPVKIWPVMVAPLLSKVTQKGGSVRVYFVARAVDQAGRGWVTWRELTEYLDFLGVGRRQQERWIKAAVKRHLFRVEERSETRYFYTSLAGAANLLGVDRVGWPVWVSGVDLCGFGWKSIVWAGIEALHPSPMSQTTKADLYDVSPRTQRNYLREVPHEKRGNQASHGRYTRDKYQELLHAHKGYFFQSKGGMFITQKLPDSVVIGSTVAAPANRGRSRKAQRALSSVLVTLWRGKVVPFRLFYDDEKDPGKHVKATCRKIRKLGARDQIGPYDGPKHIFAYTGKRVKGINLWDAHAITV